MDESGSDSYDSRMSIKVTPHTRLSDHREGLVGVACQACWHEREMTAAALAQLIGWETRIEKVIPRMRCSACGAHRAHVFIFYPRRPRGWGKNPA